MKFRAMRPSRHHYQSVTRAFFSGHLLLQLAAGSRPGEAVDRISEAATKLARQQPSTPDSPEQHKLSGFPAASLSDYRRAAGSLSGARILYES